MLLKKKGGEGNLQSIMFVSYIEFVKGVGKSTRGTHSQLLVATLASFCDFVLRKCDLY